MKHIISIKMKHINNIKMKHITYLVLLCMCTMYCKAQTNNYAVISGTINDKGVDSIYLLNQSINFSKVIAVNNGSFNDTITTDKIRDYVLNTGKAAPKLYLQNGYNLNISIDSSDISFSGVGADVNNYYKAKLKFRGVNDDAKKLMNTYSLLESSEQELLTLIDKTHGGISTILKNAKIEDENFMAFEKENIFWERACILNFYSTIRPGMASTDTTKTYTPSPGFLPQEVLNFKPDNEDLFINSFFYNAFSRGSINYKVSTELSNIERVDEKIQFIDSVYNTIDMLYFKDAFLMDNGSQLIANKDKKIAKTYLDYFTSKLSDENAKRALGYSYNQYLERINARQRIKKGDLSPKFVDYENFAGGTTSLDDLKGKYVYIDVWATWCGPCKLEIPFLQDVEKKYHNKNIEFVSISVDEKPAYDTWRNMVTDKQLSGIQLFAGSFDSQFL